MPGCRARLRVRDRRSPAAGEKSASVQESEAGRGSPGGSGGSRRLRSPLAFEFGRKRKIRPPNALSVGKAAGASGRPSRKGSTITACTRPGRHPRSPKRRETVVRLRENARTALDTVVRGAARTRAGASRVVERAESTRRDRSSRVERAEKFRSGARDAGGRCEPGAPGCGCGVRRDASARAARDRMPAGVPRFARAGVTQSAGAGARKRRRTA